MNLDQSLTRWMCFIDGENLTIRAEALANEYGFPLSPGKFYEPSVYCWFPGATDRDVLINGREKSLIPLPVRSYYYTSVVADQPGIEGIRQRLWELEFQPEVFPKLKRTMKSKGVDITLARDVLSHGFSEHYDVAVLFAGDADYVPLLQEVKRHGRVAGVAFFREEGLSSELRVEADFFLPLDRVFAESWRFFSPTGSSSRQLSGAASKFVAHFREFPDGRRLLAFEAGDKWWELPVEAELNLKELSHEMLLDLRKRALSECEEKVLPPNDPLSEY